MSTTEITIILENEKHCMLHTTGKLLTVDVENRTWQTTNVKEILESFIGGRGIATKLAHDRIPFNADPLSHENRIYFSTGPLQVSRMSFTGRMNATSLSPLTDGLASTNAGGFLSRNFAATGYSCMEIIGESEDLLAIHVSDTGVEFEPVPDLVGATVKETSAVMNERYGLDGEHLVTIGPAGENLVRYASIMTSNSRAFGRGGLGAVLGSKNIKAVSFVGDSTPAIEFPNTKTSQEIHQKAATDDHMMKRQGTTQGVDLINDLFSLPTRYFERMSFDEGVENINGDAVEEKKYKKGTCSVCAFACKLPTRDKETGIETEGPEYETVFAFGSNLMIDDIVSVMKSNELCDDLGLDTISTGVTIGAYLQAQDEFGNSDLIHELIRKVANREDVGDLLAEGVDRIHEELGVKNWTSKGLEFPGHDGRVLHGRALGYATANRGADHMYSRIHNLEYSGELLPEGLDEKPSLIAELENIKAVVDSAVLCKFSKDYITKDHLGEILGAEYNTLLQIGARIVDHERHFNNKRGFDRSNDTLPYEIDGIEDALGRYYSHRGWTDDGIVSDEKFKTKI